MNDLTAKYRQHLQGLCDVDCHVFDVRQKSFCDGQNYCGDRCKDRCDFANTHLYGCYEAQRWGGKYIYYCPLGYIFIAVAELNEVDIVESGVIAGPVLMGNAEDFDHHDDSLPVFSTKKVGDLCEIMAMLFGNLSQIIHRHSFMQTEDFLNDIYKVMDESAPAGYPILLEKELQQAIVQGDKKLSSRLLNQLLGHIFFNSNNQLDKIKSRVLELIVLLSRAAIEGGASIDQIFALNSDYIREVENFETLEKLSMWLTGVINRFISYVFELSEVKHTDTIFKVTAYIKENYREKITLEDIAGHVYLSKSYLCKIFKEEMRCSLTAYINNVRIEKGKLLLLDHTLSIVDIANMIGFDDQSYFTKVFKSVTGVSPGKYREKHGTAIGRIK